MSTFNTIHTALSGLTANQKALEVTGHNVANVNTPGYHRQEAVLQTRPAFPAAGSILSPIGGQYGAGVDVATVRRYQDQFLQQQIHRTEGQVGRWSTAHSSLQQIENMLAPGKGLDLSSLLDRFFGAWQQLATHPEEMASRLTVRSEAINLTNALNETAGKLDLMGAQINQTLQSHVDRLNDLADHMAELNAQIGMARAENRQPNDLLDQREVVLSELTRLAGVISGAGDEATGLANLDGGRALVQGTTTHHLRLEQGAGVTQIVWEEDGVPAVIPGGEIAGLLEVRDSVIPAYKSQLDTIALALSSAVNGLHATGMSMQDTPAGDFFSGTTAGGIRLSDAILADARNISATRASGALGDGSLATEIYQLYGTQLIGSQTLNQSAQSLLAQIGSAVRTAATNMDASSALQGQLFNQQQALSGVSLDEEMSNMLMFQRSYDASARILAAADEMIQIVLERMGS